MGQKIRKEELKSGRKIIQNKILPGEQKGLWDTVKMSQNKPENQITQNMTCGNENFETVEGLAQGLADCFEKRLKT